MHERPSKHEHVLFSRSLGRGNRFPKQLINVSVAEEEHDKSTKHHCVNPKLGISQYKSKCKLTTCTRYHQARKLAVAWLDG